MASDRVIFISGHMNLTPEEFAQHYEARIRSAVEDGARFIVGDAPGCDEMAQQLLHDLGVAPARVTVHHMFVAPRRHVGTFPMMGGFTSDEERDQAMTKASTEDLAWVKRRKSGTEKNLLRRIEVNNARDREVREQWPRFYIEQTEVYPVYNVQDVTKDWQAPLAVPLPQELVDRLERVTKEWHDIQCEVSQHIAQQQVNPVKSG